MTESRFLVMCFVSKALFPENLCAVLRASIMIAADKLSSRNVDSNAKTGITNLERFVPQVPIHTVSILMPNEKALPTRVVECCRGLQRVAEGCSVLQCVAVCCSAVSRSHGTHE